MDVPDWSTAVASMIGLGVGIDYALLILTRHRAALAAGREPREAVVEAVSTAGHSVLDRRARRSSSRCSACS